MSFFAVSTRAEKVQDLKPQGYVSDFAGVLTPTARDQLTALCAEVDQKTKAQIAVVTLHSLEGEPLEEFSIDLATKWGIGPKGNDRGVLILLVPSEHKYRIEVGYGLEPILPDGLVGDFGRQAVPRLRRGDYSSALLLMTQRVANVIAKDRGVTLATSLPAEAAPAESSPGVVNIGGWIVPLIFVAFFIFFPLLGFLMRLGMWRTAGRRRSGWWWLAGPWLWGGTWSGGGWGGGGFGGGGGGFGGFGGGSFGGGGASGSW